MKEKDINEYILGEHCFGQILTVNGLDYEDIPKEHILELINDMLINNCNSNLLLRETLKNCLEYLEFERLESDRSSCDQCGNWNYREKYIKPE